MFRPAILYIDDEQTNLDTFKRAFGKDYLVKGCLSGEEALKILADEDFPLVIADQRMPGMTGIELCEKLVAIRPGIIRMILTAYSEPHLLLEAINRGKVHDYIVKPWRKSDLKPVIDKAFEDYKQRMGRLRELEAQASRTEILREEIRGVFDAEGIMGAASGLKKVLEVIEKAAPTDSTILLYGETGTGKELLARTIHDSSLRKHSPFVAVHCAALAPTLLESELFGHEKGAFTGADQARIGRFETAHTGTLFLDEVSEIPEGVQVKLLRVLQEREIQKVGGNRTIPIDVRIVAATNRDLKEEIRKGRFRQDLFFRLNVIPVTIPPLRERKQDIASLGDYFLEKFGRQTGKKVRFSPEALDHLSRYDWPGNVRELQNIIERAVILAPGPNIEPDDLNLNVEDLFRVEKIEVSRIPEATSLRGEIQRREMQTLGDALRKANGNISEAARLLGVARSTLFHRLKKFGLI